MHNGFNIWLKKLLLSCVNEMQALLCITTDNDLVLMDIFESPCAHSLTLGERQIKSCYFGGGRIEKKTFIFVSCFSCFQKVQLIQKETLYLYVVSPWCLERCAVAEQKEEGQR